MIYKTKYALILAIGLILNPTAYADDSSRLTLLVGNCITCHGPEGSSLGPATPTIARLDAENFVDIMLEYKNGERPSTIMGRIAKGYTFEDFDKMAKYFATKPFIRQGQTFEPARAKKGDKYHEKYCEKCHKSGGFKKDSDGASILAGQWMPYLQFSLADLNKGSRDMPKKMKKRLKKMVSEYGEESLTDLVHFYGGQFYIQNDPRYDY
jgi:cytochrome subunit of sulfide dehydrogenase